MIYKSNTTPGGNKAPLKNVDEWENDLLERYPDPSSISTNKTAEEFRNYDEPSRDMV